MMQYGVYWRRNMSWDCLRTLFRYCNPERAARILNAPEVRNASLRMGRAFRCIAGE